MLTDRIRPNTLILPPPPEEPPPSDTPSPRASILAASFQSLDKLDDHLIDNKTKSYSIGSQTHLDDLDFGKTSLTVPKSIAIECLPPLSFARYHNILIFFLFNPPKKSFITSPIL